MDDLIRQLAAERKTLELVTRFLREISRLNHDPHANLVKLKSKLQKIEELVSHFETAPGWREAVVNWSRLYAGELNESENSIRHTLGNELERVLRSRGLTLSGQYPDLRTGIFTLEVDFDKGAARIWYGPKQELLGESDLGAEHIANALEEIQQKLGSKIPHGEFIEKLREACWRATRGDSLEKVPIVAVLSEMAHLMQNGRFHQDPKQQNYRTYGRADFSFDLFRINSSAPDALRSRALHLVVATMANTRTRQSFLWVPEDSTGRGTTFSHIQLETER